MSKHYSSNNKAGILSLMSPGYRNSHKSTYPKNMINDDFVTELEPGWTLSLNGNHAEVYPYHSDFLEFWNGPIYEIKSIEDKWYFTGNVTLSLD